MIQGHSSSSVKKLTFFRSFEREFSAQKINKDDRVIHKMEQKSLVVSKRKYFLGQIENCFDVFYDCTKTTDEVSSTYFFICVILFGI